MLEVYVFYDPNCRRCKRIHEVVHAAQHKLGRKVKFYNMNLAHSSVRNRIAPKYHVGRIPAIVPITGEKPQGCSELYFVGIPDLQDLVGVLNYIVLQKEATSDER